MDEKSVDAYLLKHENWQNLLDSLRNICLDTEMEETVKWGIPTYTFNKKNVVGLAAFKNHVALWFYNGVFLSDKSKKLVNAQEGATKAMRQWRFNNIDEVSPQLVRAYLLEAIENEKAGKKIKVDRNKSIEIPPELKNGFTQDPKLQAYFEELSPGKRREYAEYIGAAKREATRISRLEKSVPMIIKGIGLHDKYK
ncbi:MAG: YdeI/OmpD-associated family protein [Crocinitomicaceae bacterium]